MGKIIFIFIATFLISFSQNSNYKRVITPITQNNSRLIEKLLKKYPEYFGDILENPDKYKVQIIFTQINRDKYNRPVVKHRTYNLDTTKYFFPASMVKLPVAALALEKLNELQLAGYEVSAFTPMITIAKGKCQITKKTDFTSPEGYPYVAHYIKKIFLVSDNHAYDRLYEFVGPCEINQKLHNKGYYSAHIVQRYGTPCSFSGNMRTPEIIFKGQEGIIYKQSPTVCKEIPREISGVKDCLIGKAYFKNGKMVRTPMNFCSKNYINLKDLHEILMAIMLPLSVPKEKRFKLRKQDYRLLHKYMSMLPTESKHPDYSNKHPTMGKYLYYGGKLAKPYEVDTNIRIFNKVGMSYGFLVDCAYIIDFKHNVEFFLSAVIYVNRDGVLNDGMYDYYSVGLPFMRNLGRVFMELERRRIKPRKAKLNFYKHNYKNETEIE